MLTSVVVITIFQLFILAAPCVTPPILVGLCLNMADNIDLTEDVTTNDEGEEESKHARINVFLLIVLQQHNQWKRM